MKGVTNDLAAMNIQNACTSKYRKAVELNDLSFLDGHASFAPPNLRVSISNKSDIAVLGITIATKNKKSGEVNYYNLQSVSGFGFSPRIVSEGWTTITEQSRRPADFFQEYDWYIARATALNNEVNPRLTVLCTDDEFNSRAGDCWVKLSQSDKYWLTVGFTNGWVGYYDNVVKDQYNWQGRQNIRFLYVEGDTNKQISYYDELYSDSENKTISFIDAYDLALTRQVRPNTQDLIPLTKMYRDHRRPLTHGYLSGFIPPNKVVVSEWSDAPFMEADTKKYGNDRQTITMRGLSSNLNSPALEQFMRALMNIKNCRSLVKETDAYRYRTYLKTEEQRQKAKTETESYFSMQLKVVVQYPQESYYDREYFNEKGDLSAEILLDKTQTVCERIDASDLASVRLGDLMLGDAQKDRDLYSPDLESDAGNGFIDLNRYLWANSLQERDDSATDPRQAARHNLLSGPRPSDVTVAKVLATGGP